MQKNIENWTKTNNDKVLHFIAGLLLSLLMIISWKFVFLVVIVAILKEIVDKHIRKTGGDRMDIVATCLGAIPIIIILLIDRVI